jgi:hypothetical protein
MVPCFFFALGYIQRIFQQKPIFVCVFYEVYFFQIQFDFVRFCDFRAENEVFFGDNEREK